MDKVENTNTKVETESDLSSWTGPEVVEMPSEAIPRAVGDTVEGDLLDFTQRLISLDELRFNNTLGFSIGPTINTAFATSLNEAFDNPMFRFALGKYHAFSYESVDVRITLSDPKNLLGGIVFGWFPYVDYYDEPISYYQELLEDSSKELMHVGLINGPNTELMFFGMSQDLTFKIPWTYKYSTYRTDWITQELYQDRRPPYGVPVLWWKMLESTYVTTVTMPTALRIFVKFNNMKWYGPNNRTSDAYVQRHSGIETVVAAELGAIVASKLGSAVSDLVGSMYPESGDRGTFDSPQAMQQAYLGDTTSVSFPTTTPIFAPYIKSSDVPVPDIKSILSRPQYIGTYNQPSGTRFCNAPLHPTGGSTLYPTYFHWFGGINRYWRGGLKLHILVPGHAMVQQQLSVTVMYPGYVSTVGTSTVNLVHSSAFSGSKQIVVEMPYLDQRDYIPVYDAYPSDPWTIGDDHRGFYTTMVDVDLRVVATMLDTAPQSRMYVFISAAEDFAFYQPCPPGAYRLNNVAVQKKKKQADKKAIETAKAINVVKHCGLPMSDQVEFVKARSKTTADPGVLVRFDTIYDYMKLWSRCLPFYDYDNDHDQEPIPDATVGFRSAAWYTPVDRTRDLDSNNSWYFTNDYVSYFSNMFLYYRGSIGFKIVLAPALDGRTSGYVYATLDDPERTIRQKAYSPFTYPVMQFPGQSNLGAGTVVTPVEKQPLLELTVPYRGTNVWSYTINNAYYRGILAEFGIKFDSPNAGVDHNLVLQDSEDNMADAMFRKIDSDFALALEMPLPPPTMWMAKGFDWSS